jgi:hypothetical protein
MPNIVILSVAVPTVLLHTEMSLFWVPSTCVSRTCEALDPGTAVDPRAAIEAGLGQQLGVGQRRLVALVEPLPGVRLQSGVNVVQPFTAVIYE